MLRIVNYTKEEEKLFRESRQLLESHTCMCEECKSARAVLDSITRAEARRYCDRIQSSLPTCQDSNIPGKKYTHEP